MYALKLCLKLCPKLGCGRFLNCDIASRQYKIGDITVLRCDKSFLELYNLGERQGLSKLSILALVLFTLCT